jgi:CelD/BcsL family acetyltransferase involved in cellulose biosynthesis
LTGEGGELRARVVADAAELDELADDWRRLAAERGNAFVTPDWAFAALATIDRDAEPRVVAVNDPAGRLVGVLPLVDGGGGPLRFAGSRPADRLHPAASLADEDRVAAAAAVALARHADGRLTAHFDRVDTEARWPQAFADAVRPRLRVVAQPPEELPYIPLAGRSYDEFMATRSRGLRSQVGRRRRALEKDHEVSLTVVDEPARLQPALAELFRLHDLRSDASGRASSLDGPGVREFHNAFLGPALERGWLRLCLLEVDGTSIAAWYGWSIGGRYAYYQAGFDPAWSRSSPGMLLLADTIRLATEEGASEYDLLRGDEAFKRRFADDARQGASLTVAGRFSPALGRAAAARRLRTLWRRLPEDARARLRRLRGDGA